MQQLTDIQQVNHAIMFGQWTNIEIQSMVDAIKFARANLARQNKRAFKVGDTVKFTVFRDHRLLNLKVRLVKPRDDTYYLTVDDEADADAERERLSWLGASEQPQS